MKILKNLYDLNLGKLNLYYYLKMLDNPNHRSGITIKIAIHKFIKIKNKERLGNTLYLAESYDTNIFVKYIRLTSTKLSKCL